mgnify:CR=1 FL=1
MNKKYLFFSILGKKSLKKLVIALLFSLILGLINSKCDHVTVHARKGWLSGLDPKQNRTIPPLKYNIVYDLKKDFSGYIYNAKGLYLLSEIDDEDIFLTLLTGTRGTGIRKVRFRPLRSASIGSFCVA